MRCLIGVLALVGTACGTTETVAGDGVPDPGVSSTVPAEPTTEPLTEPSTSPSSDGADGTSTETSAGATTAPTTVGTETTASNGDEVPVPDPAAVAQAEAVLVAVGGRNENVGDAYDIGSGTGCPLLAGFDGDWLAEAGGVLYCSDADFSRSLGAGLSSVFAVLIAEEGFELVDGAPTEDGSITSWCNAESCIASWSGGGIDVFAFVFEAEPEAAAGARTLLTENLIELVDGVGNFDVGMVAASSGT